MKNIELVEREEGLVILGYNQKKYALKFNFSGPCWCPELEDCREILREYDCIEDAYYNAGDSCIVHHKTKEKLEWHCIGEVFV